MSGHSHWAGIKHKKGTTDQKRGQLFSKLTNAISTAAKQEPNPQFNPRLRSAIDKAKENKVPLENIERAIKRANEIKDLEKLIMEAYGPEGSAILIEVITDNKNRTVAEIKKILSHHNAKWAESGSVRWVFEKISESWQAKFPQTISDESKEKMSALIEELDDQNDVQNIYTNAA